MSCRDDMSYSCHVLGEDLSYRWTCFTGVQVLRGLKFLEDIFWEDMFCRYN